jgi:hypothetical protein
MLMGFSVGVVIYGFGASFPIISSVELLRAGWCFLIKKDVDAHGWTFKPFDPKAVPWLK